jgi:transcription initiation factor TFIIIB Brf1 subunit/transcription initiation factor TFIIB
MDPVNEIHLIISSKDAKHYKKNVTNVIPLGDEKELIPFIPDLEDEKTYNNITLNVSIPISTAVTAYARMYMSKFKRMFKKLGIILYYSDTDSFIINKSLDQKYIGSELGKLKLEHTFDEGVYHKYKVELIKNMSM